MKTKSPTYILCEVRFTFMKITSLSSMFNMYGFLLMPAFIELLQARAEIRGIWRYLLPVALVMAQSNLYELIEWLAAVVFGGPLGQAYLGTQGDVWDAQRDSALAALGAVCGLTVYRIYQRSRGQK